MQEIQDILKDTLAILTNGQCLETQDIAELVRRTDLTNDQLALLLRDRLKNRRNDGRPTQHASSKPQSQVDADQSAYNEAQPLSEALAACSSQAQALETIAQYNKGIVEAGAATDLIIEAKLSTAKKRSSTKATILSRLSADPNWKKIKPATYRFKTSQQVGKSVKLLN